MRSGSHLKSRKCRAERHCVSTTEHHIGEAASDVVSIAPMDVGGLTDTTVPSGWMVDLPPPPPGDVFDAGVLRTDERLALLEAMPVAVFLIDDLATVRYANRRTANMMAIPATELLGRNVLDFVCVEDLDFAVALFDGGRRFDGSVMGPSRIRYVDGNGEQHWTQVWSQSAPPELGGEGFIVTLTSESVRDVLATAVTSVATDDDLDRTLLAIAESARALPFEAIGSVLAIEPAIDGLHRQFRMIGRWPIDHSSINALGTPWRHAVADETACDIDDVGTSQLPPRARDMLLDAGVRAMFVRPIHGPSGEVEGVLVVFRDDAGEATANQDDHLDDAARLAGLAFAQKRRRQELESAAHLDALSGVANRAAFNDRLNTERRGNDVLFIDLDHFKAVNDTYGHAIGDQVVSMAAARIVDSIRRVDTVYRTGGDEFVVLCEATGEVRSERVAMAERIIERLQIPFEIDGHSVAIGATVGIAAAGKRSLESTVRAADRALLEAKQHRRSSWSHADD